MKQKMGGKVRDISWCHYNNIVYENTCKPELYTWISTQQGQGNEHKMKGSSLTDE